MKKILFSVLLAFMTLSCGNNFVSPSSYTKEQIDKKYPYWKVGVENFFIYVNTNKDEYIELTVAEKRRFLQSLALMRVAINSDEFVEIMNRDKDNFQVDVDIQDAKAAVKCNTGDPFNMDRLIEVLRAVSYDVTYGKGDLKNEQAWAIGPNYYFYAYYGSGVELSAGKKIWSPNKYLVDWYGIETFSALMFHEHLHNIGFTHNNDTVYAMQKTIGELMGRITGGDLKDKYRKAYDELTAYYITEYKHLLVSSTIYTPSK